MLGFPLGILSAAGAGGVAFASDYELISTTVLGGTAASVTFSNLGDFSSTYKHLQIRAVTKGATSDTGIDLTFNSDTGNNYSFHSVAGDGSSVGVSSSTSRANIPVTYIYATTANRFSGAVIDILDSYSTTKNTTIRSLNGDPFISLFSGAWYNTAAITSITLTGRTQNIATGSRLSIYGLRG